MSFGQWQSSKSSTEPSHTQQRQQGQGPGQAVCSSRGINSIRPAGGQGPQQRDLRDLPDHLRNAMREGKHSLQSCYEHSTAGLHWDALAVTIKDVRGDHDCSGGSTHGVGGRWVAGQGHARTVVQFSSLTVWGRVQGDQAGAGVVLLFDEILQGGEPQTDACIRADRSGQDPTRIHRRQLRGAQLRADERSSTSPSPGKGTDSVSGRHGPQVINADALGGEQDEVRQKSLASGLNGTELSEYSNEFALFNIEPDNSYDIHIVPSTSSRQQSSNPQHESIGGSGDRTKSY